MTKKRLILGLFLILSLFCFTGCEERKEEGEYEVYYLNMDMTKTEPESYTPVATEPLEIVKELVHKLQDSPRSVELRQTLPSAVEIKNITASSYQVNIDFSEQYYEMGAIEEVLVRSAIAKTVLQVETYPYVSFTVSGKPLTGKSGRLVGSMNKESFVENPGEQINNSTTAELTLYFSSADGLSLVEETREVHYTTNMSLEKVIIEQLIQGPENADSVATIPSASKLINVSVVDGVCYVNFDENFQNQNKEIAEEIVLYSLVNSLAKSSNVQKVQISINGDTSGKVRFNYDLSVMYQKNEDLIYTEPSTEGETETKEN